MELAWSARHSCVQLADLGAPAAVPAQGPLDCCTTAQVPQSHPGARLALGQRGRHHALQPGAVLWLAARPLQAARPQAGPCSACQPWQWQLPCLCWCPWQPPACRLPGPLGCSALQAYLLPPWLQRCLLHHRLHEQPGLAQARAWPPLACLRQSCGWALCLWACPRQPWLNAAYLLLQLLWQHLQAFLAAGPLAAGPLAPGLVLGAAFRAAGEALGLPGCLCWLGCQGHRLACLLGRLGWHLRQPGAVCTPKMQTAWAAKCAGEREV